MLSLSVESGFRTLVSPAVILSELGVQFESTLFATLRKLLRFKRQRATAYHPQVNGMAVRWHRTLKASLDEPFWLQVLPFVLVGFRSAVRAEFATSPAQLVYGENLRLPGGLILDKRRSWKLKSPP